MSKKILVVGANLGNKGAQSMLFITVDEMKKKFKDSEVYFAGAEPFDNEKYAFRYVFFPPRARQIALRNTLPLFLIVQCVMKDCIKWLLGRRSNLWRFMDARRFIPQMDLIIDVSGFSLGDKWSTEVQESYLDNIRLAKKYNIPIYMMPQSFGSFNYNSRQMYLRDEIKELMSYPKVVYARETEGYHLLNNEFQLQNVVLSTDMVLQNKGVLWENIYCTEVKWNIPRISIQNAVGIIPNMQCFRHGDKEKNLILYQDIISHLLKSGKRVYVFRHSGDDLEICKRIANCFRKEKLVTLIENDFTCLEYDKFVSNFEFIVCSRYHGIVHAYRNYVPCIALGWAVKYRELAKNVDQAEYAFDITDITCTSETVIGAINKLMNHIPEEKEKIKKQVVRIQENDCFQCISDWAEGNE